MLTVAGLAVAVGSSAALHPLDGAAHPTGYTAASRALPAIVAMPTVAPAASATDAPRVAAPRRAAPKAHHTVTEAQVQTPRAAKPAARPAAKTIRVWTSGFQAQLNACKGAVDLTGAYGVPTIGEKWTCGGASFPRAGSLVRLTGLHAGLYRVGGVVAVLNAYRDDSADIPRGHSLLFQTCIGDNPRTESFTALTRVG